MLAKSKGVIVGVIRYSGVRNTQLTRKQRCPFSVRLDSLASVGGHRPVYFMEEAFIVAPGAHGLVREVEDFGRKA